MPAMSEVAAKPTKRWPPETIELAYQLWAGAADRNAAETCRILTTIVDEAPPETSVKRWRDTQQWVKRSQLEYPERTPLPTLEHPRVLGVAVLYAVELLRKTITGERVPTAVQLDAAKHVEAAHRSLILKQADIDKGDRRKRVVVRDNVPASLASMSDDELEQEEQRRRERDSAG
jgi:hypothetical protein